MAKELVVRCTCDACKKETSKRYLVKFGIGDWDDDDIMKHSITKDLCQSCYDAMIGLISGDKMEKTKPVTTRKVKKSGGAPKVGGKLMYDKDKFIELIEEGHSYPEISEIMEMTYNQVAFQAARLKKAGVIKGAIVKMGNPELEKPRMETVVDKDGLVLETKIV